MKSIFILASERSGTNLLRSMLSDHSRIAGPPPAPVMSFFWEHAHLYRALPDHPGPLIEDLHYLLGLEGSAYRWEWVPSPEELKEQLQGKGMIEVLLAFYRAYAEHFGKDVFLSKESQLFRFPFALERKAPDPFFIYLVRDGRDVALSERNSPVKRRPVFLLAERWREEQVSCWNAYSELVEDGKAMMIRYEDLLTDPEKVLKELLSAMGLEMEEGMLSFHERSKTQEEASRSSLWQNIGSPLKKDNIGKYRKGLSKREIKIFEKEAGDLLLHCGYDPEFPHSVAKGVGSAQEFYYRVVNKAGKRLFKRTAMAREEGIGVFLKERGRLKEKRKTELTTSPS